MRVFKNCKTTKTYVKIIFTYNLNSNLLFYDIRHVVYNIKNNLLQRKLQNQF